MVGYWKHWRTDKGGGGGAVDPRNKIGMWFISRFSGLVSSEAAFLVGGGGGDTVPPLFQVPLKCPLILCTCPFPF